MSKTEIVKSLSDSPTARKQTQEIRMVAELQQSLSSISQQISQVKQTTEQQTADSLEAISATAQSRLSEALDQIQTEYDKPIQDLAGQIKTVTESTATISDQAKTEIPNLLTLIRKEVERLEALANSASQDAGTAKESAGKARKQARNASVHAHNTGKLMVVGMALSALVASLVTCGIWLNVM